VDIQVNRPTKEKLLTHGPATVAT